ncbi:hypothetical protein VXO74_01100 [Acinetobacter junii]|uniref:hypothetical protein n=1 Tax=Acinetobacter junii TaxID=40215 RepID=UPI003A892C43
MKIEMLNEQVHQAQNAHLKTVILGAVKKLAQIKVNEFKPHFSHFIDSSIDFMLHYTEINGVDVTEAELIQAYLHNAKEMERINAKFFN